MRRNAIVWNDFFEIMKNEFCEHITIEKEREERFFVNSNYLCKNCYEKYKKFCNPKNILKRELGLKL